MGPGWATWRYKKAVMWWRRAAEQNYPQAQFYLGLMYAKGQGVEKDYVTAYAWLNIAAAGGVLGAKDSKDDLAKNMTYNQEAEAKRLSKEMQIKETGIDLGEKTSQ